MFSLLGFACSKKKDDPAPTTSGTFQFQAKVDGVLHQSNAVGILTANNCSISGSFGNTSVGLSMDNPPAVGTYTLMAFSSSNFYSGSYNTGSATFSTQDNGGSGTGTLDITSVSINGSGNVTSLKGTFSFTAKDASNNTVSITEGVINY